MTNPTYNTIQQVFAMNLFSNFASNKKGTPQELTNDLSTILSKLLSNADMQSYIGNWEVLWGPVVNSYGKDINNKVASNALFVATNNQGIYVVATAGTNPISAYGWLTEDFDVRTMVPWDSNNEAPDAPRIANGTNIGLQHLLGMTDQSGNTLMQFLQNTFKGVTTPQQLVVTGHSLGGALSSVLALNLNNNLTTFNPAQTVTVSAMPTAGATPGNKAFSEYFSSQLGTRTVRFWNKLDPVPHAWQADMVENIPFLFYPYLVPNPLVQALGALVLEQSLQGTQPYLPGGRYTQLQAQTPPLPGQVNIGLTAPLTAAQVAEAFIDFGAKKILASFGVSGIVADAVIAAINEVIIHFEGIKTIDNALAEIEQKLEKLFGKHEYLEHLFVVLKVIMKQLEGALLFLIQLGYQHVTSYDFLMGMPNMHNLCQYIINKAVSNGSLSADYKNLGDQLTDPLNGLKNSAAQLGDVFQRILTPEFIAQAGMPTIPAGINEPQAR